MHLEGCFWAQLFFENIAKLLLPFKDSCEDCIFSNLKELPTFSIPFNDVMLKKNGLLRNFFNKRFEEKYKHNKVALNFALKQCFS